MDIYIIGASFAGISCALRAKELYPEANITLIEKSSTAAFLPGGLLLYLQGQFKNLTDAVFITPSELKKRQITLKLQETFLDCQLDQHQMITDKATYHYDKLILASGSEQKSVNIKVINDDSWNPAYKSYEAAQRTLTKLASADPVAVIGAGQAGMEVASSLQEIGKTVHVFEAMDYPLFKYFDADFLNYFVAEIKKIPRLFFHFNEEITQIIKNEQYEIQFAQHKMVCDYVFATVNVHPEVSNFTEKFALHSDNTIQTDEYLQTSAADVFAIGDLIHSPLAGRGEAYLPQINHAVRSGNVAAENLLKPRQKLTASLRTLGTKLFGFYLASTGLIEAEAFFYPQTISSCSFSLRASLVSENKIYCKAIYESESQKLLGLQLLSKENCLAKINTAALAIEQGVTLSELKQQDTFFQPLFTGLADPLNQIYWESGADHAF